MTGQQIGFGQRSLAMLAFAAAGAGVLQGCAANPDARAIAVLAPTSQVAAIQTLEINLVASGSFSDPKAIATLNRRGWESGEFARNFVTDLAKRLEAHGVTVTQVRSNWGTPLQFSLAPSVASVAAAQMTLRADSIRYLIHQTTLSETLVVGHFSLPLHVLLRRDGKLLWEGQAVATSSNADPSAASQFGIALSNSLVDARLVKSR